MKKLIKEAKRLQQLAGLMKENTETPIETFTFGYDLDNVEQVEKYVRREYRTANHSDTYDLKDIDAIIYVGYGDDTMNGLEIYNEEMLRDETLMNLINACDGEGHFEEQEDSNPLKEDRYSKPTEEQVRKYWSIMVEVQPEDVVTVLTNLSNGTLNYNDFLRNTTDDIIDSFRDELYNSEDDNY